MTFDKVNRRTHLYLGLALTPWFLLYAASSVLLNHTSWFPDPKPTRADWSPRFAHPYHLPAVPDDDNVTALARQILRDHGMIGRYRASVVDGKLIVYRNSLLSTVRLTYDPAAGRIAAENKRFRWTELLRAAHFRAGFVYPMFVELAWGIFVDLVVLATLVWVASGVYMWTRLGRFRFWGWVCLAGGCGTFVLAVLGLR